MALKASYSELRRGSRHAAARSPYNSSYKEAPFGSGIYEFQDNAKRSMHLIHDGRADAQPMVLCGRLNRIVDFLSLQPRLGGDETAPIITELAALVEG